MGAQQGNGQKVGFERRDAHEFGISRSRLGWLSVQFSGGPSYPEMVATLEEMVDRYSGLIKRGERMSGSQWIHRMEQSGVQISEREIQAVRTLME